MPDTIEREWLAKIVLAFGEQNLQLVLKPVICVLVFLRRFRRLWYRLTTNFVEYLLYV